MDFGRVPLPSAGDIRIAEASPSATLAPSCKNGFESDGDWSAEVEEAETLMRGLDVSEASEMPFESAEVAALLDETAVVPSPAPD